MLLSTIKLPDCFGKGARDAQKFTYPQHVSGLVARTEEVHHPQKKK